MRNATTVGLGLIGLVAALWVAHRFDGIPSSSVDLSPPNDPIPRHGSIDDRDIPADHQV